MTASRSDYSRRLDWSAVKGDALAQLTAQVTRFVAGIRGPRRGGVSRKQILTWFSGTPEEFVEKAILEAVTESKIRCCMRSLGSNSRANGAHEYVVDTAGVFADALLSLDLLASDLADAKLAATAKNAEALTVALQHIYAKASGLEDALANEKKATP